MKKLKRVWVYEEDYDEVISFAKDCYKRFDFRAPNFKPLHCSFPASLNDYLKTIKGDKFNFVYVRKKNIKSEEKKWKMKILKHGKKWLDVLQDKL